MENYKFLRREQRKKMWTKLCLMISNTKSMIKKKFINSTLLKLNFSFAKGTIKRMKRQAKVLEKIFVIHV